MSVLVLCGDWIEQLKSLPDKSHQMCATSPPYWGLRNYKVDGQIGQEKTPEEYVQKLVTGFREVKRVLRDDGTLWLNLGDSYARNGGTGKCGPNAIVANTKSGEQQRNCDVPFGLKPKDLIGIPWRVAFALQSDGWHLRSAIPWVKRNCMPESVTDRPATSTEMVFLLSKSQSYFFDMEAVKVPASASYSNDGRWKTGPTPDNEKKGYDEALARNPKRVHAVFEGQPKTKRNLRQGDWFFQSWQGLYSEDDELLAFIVNNTPYKGAHFATWPAKLVEPMVKAGTSERGACVWCGNPIVRVVKKTPMVIDRSERGANIFGNNHSTCSSGTMVSPAMSETLGWEFTCDCGTHDLIEPCKVIDPFAGSGTTALVCKSLVRDCTLIELNPEYLPLIQKRIA